ncbi:MAG TPA: hypothetical protein VE547_10495 [Mycobacteriales bacterium]|nr:hypothetical protein [Mycobacteriales bacterium]
MPGELRSCPSCRAERAFEAPPCRDGHGPECAELACRDCGAALLVDPPVTARRRPRRRPALGAAA